MKNSDEIDESHKSQLKNEYEVYLINYIIQIKNLKKVNWAFEVFKVFFKNPKNLGFESPVLQPCYRIIRQTAFTCTVTPTKASQHWT